MAKIVPYGDLNAHGSLAGSVSFRRRYNYVVFQKKPYPKQPNSAGQIAQRTAFKSALDDWYQYDAQSKEYFRLRGAQLGMTGLNLFIRAKLLNIMPSTIAISLKQVTSAQIINIRSPITDGFNWEFQPVPQEAGFARIVDNDNSYIWLNTYPGSKIMGIEVSGMDVEFLEYQFRDGIAYTVIDHLGATRNIISRIPESPPNSDSILYYISTDGSAFYDSALTHLAATNNF